MRKRTDCWRGGNSGGESNFLPLKEKEKKPPAAPQLFAKPKKREQTSTKETKKAPKSARQPRGHERKNSKSMIPVPDEELVGSYSGASSFVLPASAQQPPIAPPVKHNAPQQIY